MRAHHEAVAREETGEFIVAIDVLFHAMHDLDDALEFVFGKVGDPKQNAQLQCSIT